MSKSILYLAAGDEKSTSMMKARALQRLGHSVQVVNLNECHPPSIWARRINNWTGYRLLQRRVGAFISSRMSARTYDIAWVDSGSMVGLPIVELLHRHARQVINYNHDDPTGVRDGNAWNSFKRAIPSYDLLVTVRRETEAELIALGARRVLRVWRSYDEVAHRPRQITSGDWALWGSEIVFVGTWMPERSAFIAALLRSGLPLVIYGDFWPKAEEWADLKAAWRGPAVYGDDYAKAIQCSKITLGLLSKENRDLHTTRTAEIPALGGLFCAERTDEHLQLFREGEEAVYWADETECITVCKRLLRDEGARAKIRQRGNEKVAMLGLGHERILECILQNLTQV